MRAKVQKLLASLSGFDSDQQRDAVHELRGILGPRFPAAMLEHYRVSARYQTRHSCIYYSIPYCRWSEAALQLGIEGTQDKSKFVRYRAFQLLALSQKVSAAQHVDSLARSISGKPKGEDMLACLMALDRKNSNCFLDRMLSGNVFIEWREILADGTQRQVKECKPCKQ